MKVIWDLDYVTAIPLNNISCFEIGSIDEWCSQSKREWKGGKYYVRARYTICTGASDIVFSSDSREECIKYIELIH